MLGSVFQTSLSALSAAELAIQVSANNLANAHTDGFKASHGSRRFVSRVGARKCTGDLAVVIQRFAFFVLELFAQGDLEQRIEFAFRVCTSRQPTKRETNRLRDYFLSCHALLEDEPQNARAMLTNGHLDDFDPIDAAAWSSLSSVLLNLHEFITKN